MMRITNKLFLLLLMSTIAILAPFTLAAKKKPQKLSVRFLARGTAVYSSFSGNQSEYLVEVQSPHQQPLLARLLYRHAQQHPEIADAPIDSGRPVILGIARDPRCDQDYATLATVWLPSAEGGWRAHPSLRFIGNSERPVIAADLVLPCYVIAPREIHWKQTYKYQQ